jgi:hypothetical protein
MLDTSNTNLYRVSSSLQRDVDGRLIRRMRRAPAISNENRRVFYSELELDLEPGLGEERGHASFTMTPVVASVSGTVTYGDDVDLEDADVTITVDGVPWPIETTTDEDGDFEFDGVPAGEVVISVVGDVDGITYCGQQTETHSPFTPTVTQFIAGPRAPTWCATSVELGLTHEITLTATISPPCVVNLEYLWTWWDDTTSEANPLGTSTEVSPVFEVDSAHYAQSKGILKITDTVTGWTDTSAEFNFNAVQCV